jgi:hypothetical protein
VNCETDLEWFTVGLIREFLEPVLKGLMIF